MVISSINVDLTRLTPAPIAYAKQGDANTRYIAVSLYDDGEPYVIPSGMAAAFRLGDCGQKQRILRSVSQPLQRLPLDELEMNSNLPPRLLFPPESLP